MNTHPNLLSIENSLLVVVDLQTKLSKVIPEQDAQQTSQHTQSLLKAADLLDIPVLVTEQYPKGLGATETAISDLFTESTPVFEKTGFSCCACDDFVNALETSERQQIVLVGQETHVCILQTALELIARDLQVYVVDDAVSSRNPVHKTHALQRMQQQGITIINYESVLFEWLRDAKHPHFKTISALLT